MSVKPHPTIEGAWQIDWWPNGRKGKREYETYFGTRERWMMGSMDDGVKP